MNKRLKALAAAWVAMGAVALGDAGLSARQGAPGLGRAAPLRAEAFRGPLALSGQASPPENEQEWKDAEAGAERMMNADFGGAIAIFRRIQASDPTSPLGFALEADVDWWKIYLTRGNLGNPNVFESLSEATTPYDPDFHRLTGLAIQKAVANIRAGRDRARNYLYEGLAYALEARLEALRDHSLATARAGKKMRNLSLMAVKLDANLTDANLALGIYNYFEATLPGYVRMLRFFIGLPGGNRQLGLRQLTEAADKAPLTHAEAKFQLAKSYSRQVEQKYAKSLELFQQMAGEYPANPLFKLLVAGLQVQLGQTSKGETLYQEVIKTTAGMEPALWKPLHDQAQKALASHAAAGK